MAEKDKPEETPRQRFERMARMRMNKALKQVQLIGNLSGPGYEYSQEDVDKMRDAFTDALAQALSRFNKPGKSAPDFQL